MKSSIGDSVVYTGSGLRISFVYLNDGVLQIPGRFSGRVNSIMHETFVRRQRLEVEDKCCLTFSLPVTTLPWRGVKLNG